MSVLVVHGSKRGGTQGLAEQIAAELHALGDDVRVEPARGVKRLEDAEAVVVAGGLYAGRWHKDARRFVRKHEQELAAVPVWLVASGPLDTSADDGALPPVEHVREAMERVHARGEVTFGGRLEPDATGFPASAMAKTKAGDWRNPERVRAWAATVHGDLAGQGAVPVR
ncbi:flavodoxin domain-containing protein [Actinotalea sp. Marseille-Q4924]|uniref:flavodoxin domain-containing protein n=1 Tax=Actinotalea sp. Marseille-Q4924 TaxID=2866571 RepID=UPI001CE49646|nr:flavodoxin domain-containing protein [Actinotalea sp. Marseille-Q4924]